MLSRRLAVSLPLRFLPLALALAGCAGSTGEDASSGANALSGGSGQCAGLDLDTPGAGTPRARLIAAIHADFRTLQLADLEDQGTEFVVRSIRRNPTSGSIGIAARLQSKTGGRPIDWDRTSFPADFRASAKAAGGFEFTHSFATNDCGATFHPDGELSIAGLSDGATGDPSPSLPTGTYEIDTPFLGGSVVVSASDGSGITFAIHVARRMSPFNQGNLEPSRAVDNGEAWVFSDPSMDCRIEIKAARGGIELTHDNECGFGFNVSAEGFYRKR